MSELSITPQNGTEDDDNAGIDPVKLGRIMDEIRAEQNLLMAILGGLAASIAAAVIWAMIAYTTGYMLGIVAIGVGFLVGYSVSYLGKGLDLTFGIVGAFFALFGVLLGNLLTVIIYAMQTEAVPFLVILDLLLASPGTIIEILAETFSPLDLIFYGIAVYEGYKLSFRRISPEDLAGAQKIATVALPPTPPQTGV